MGSEMTEADAGVAAARILRCSVQNYDWGVKGEQSTVARLWSKNWGKEIEPDKPYAEFWMGSHVSGPSFLAGSAAAGKTLKCWVSENPGVLGDRVVERWGNDLPFLFKVLSVAKALSIQAHPDRELAKVLNKMHPNIYKDPNHKPEMAIAITEFKALCGFVSAKELKDVLSNVPEIKQLVGQEDATRLIDIKEEDGGEEVRAVLQSLFTKLMSASGEIVSGLVVKLKSRLNEESKVRMLNEKEELALLLEKQYPDDIGVISSFFFNYVKLNPGEGLYIGANEPHAYVSGECIECMATSDNVVRAGLTPKYKDIQTLCSMLSYKLGFPGILQAIPLNPHISRYTPPFDEFEVDHCLLPAGEYILYPAVHGPCLFVVMAGEGILQSGSARRANPLPPAAPLPGPGLRRLPPLALPHIGSRISRDPSAKRPVVLPRRAEQHLPQAEPGVWVRPGLRRLDPPAHQPDKRQLLLGSGRVRLLGLDPLLLPPAPRPRRVPQGDLPPLLLEAESLDRGLLREQEDRRRRRGPLHRRPRRHRGPARRRDLRPGDRYLGDGPSAAGRVPVGELVPVALLGSVARSVLLRVRHFLEHLGLIRPRHQVMDRGQNPPAGVLFSFLIPCGDRLVLAGLCNTKLVLWEVNHESLEYKEIGAMPRDLMVCLFDRRTMMPNLRASSAWGWAGWSTCSTRTTTGATPLASAGLGMIWPAPGRRCRHCLGP